MSPKPYEFTRSRETIISHTPVSSESDPLVVVSGQLWSGSGGKTDGSRATVLKVKIKIKYNLPSPDPAQNQAF